MWIRLTLAPLRRVRRPGTGTVCTCLNLVIKSAGLPPPITLAVDVNPRACATTLATARENGVTSIDAIQADLAAPLLQRLAGTVDVLLFNPPYVPTPDEEVGGCDLSAAWAGGERGRRVLDRLLPRIPSLLTPPTPGYPGGCAYIIVLEENDPAELKSIAGSMGLAAACIASTKAKNERLHVLKLYWPPAATQDAAAQSAGAAES